MTKKSSVRNKLRIFIDTSALLAGLNSPTGAAGVILSEAFAKNIIAIISPQVIEEAERIIPAKFPRLHFVWTTFLFIPPHITRAPSLKAVQQAYQLLPTNDAPILASAIQIKPDVLITWNTKDFMRPQVIEAVHFPILRPGECLDQFFI